MSSCSLELYRAEKWSRFPVRARDPVAAESSVVEGDVFLPILSVVPRERESQPKTDARKRRVEQAADADVVLITTKGGSKELPTSSCVYSSSIV